MAGLSSRLVASPCCLPQLALDPLLHLYRGIGFGKIELFTSAGWASAVDPSGDADDQHKLRRRVADRGMRVTSMHLPPVTAGLEESLGLAVRIAEHAVQGGNSSPKLPAVTRDVDESVAQAAAAARFARELGAEVVLFKATTRDLYIESAGKFLQEINGLGLTPVLQNHAGAAISTLDDFREVLAGIGDPRIRTLLEVGHFARVGIDWREAYDILGETIALVHVNDIDDRGRSVLFGTGTVDFAGLLRHLDNVGYTGNIVVELELDGHTNSVEPTMTGLRRALEFLRDVAL